MEAVVLAGGKGSRLLPLTEDLPKPLVTIGDKPILEILLTRMKSCGVTRVHLAVNHLADMIEKKIGDGGRFGLNISYWHEKQPLSTVGPIKRIGSLPEHFIVANGDILTDLDFSDLYKSHVTLNAELTVAVHRRTNTVDYGVLEVNNEGLVTSFAEKPSEQVTVSMGIYVFSRELLAIVPDNKPFGFDDLMHLMLNRHKPVHTYSYEGYWLDIGRPEDYLQARRDIHRLNRKGE